MNTETTAKKTKQCIHCEKDINLKYRTCPICGGQQDDKIEARAPQCPRCKVHLQSHIVDGEEYDICGECGGMWLDRDEFHRATRERIAYEKVADKGEYLKAPVRGEIEYIPCIRCGKLMNRRNFGKISGVIIDRCKQHGVWLDAGELEKIQHFIADGGLDQSRDREISRNREELKELATQVDQNTFTQRLLHFWDFKRILFRGW